MSPLGTTEARNRNGTKILYSNRPRPPPGQPPPGHSQPGSASGSGPPSPPSYDPPADPLGNAA